MFSIGDFARLTGVSAKKLRHYDSIGLFEPAFVDPWSRYRFYVAAQIPRLRQIVALRDLGIPLARIAEVAEGGSEALREALVERRRQVLAQQEELARNLAALEIVIEGEGVHDVVIRTRPPGTWASLRATIPSGADLGPLFVEAEEVVRDQGLRARLAPAAVLHGSKGKRSEVEILIPITGQLEPTGRVTMVRTSPARIASRLVEGEYPGLQDADRWAKAWAKTAGYQLTGPTWVSYLRFSAEPDLAVPDEFLTARDDYVSEIQAEVEP